MKSNKGFSLVELIVVIAIMAIIAAVAVPVYNTYITKAQDGSDQNTVSEVTHAADVAIALQGGTVTYTWNNDRTVLTATFTVKDACTDTLAVLPGVATADTTSNGFALKVEFDHKVSTSVTTD